MVKGRPNILHIEVELGGRVYSGDLETEARVDTNPAGLNQALAEQPGRFAWWATLETLARTQAEEVDRERGTLHAELYSHYEAVLAATNTEGKPARATVEKIKSEILKHPPYRALQVKQEKANEALGLLTVARQTMQMRKDVLMAVASNMRALRDIQDSDHLKETRERVRQRGRT